MAPLQVMYWLWDAWIASWILAAIWSARTAARAPVWSELWRDAVTLAGAIVLFQFSAPEASSGSGPLAGLHALLLAPLWRVGAPAAWGLVGLTAAGLAFSWWARLHLGRLWSGLVGRKAEHRVVDTGPYRLVRHPIYSGMLAALLAMALLKGTAAAIVAFALVSAGLWLKARLEERFLRAELGAETYEAYSRRTPMLLPFAPRIG
jgi:protein-S-isoprenylcysteine O-methyltransferase Ste14